MTRDESLFRPSELLQLYQADVRALLVILERHRNRLTPVEASTVAAIALEHGIEFGEIPG